MNKPRYEKLPSGQYKCPDCDRADLKSPAAVGSHRSWTHKFGKRGLKAKRRLKYARRMGHIAPISDKNARIVTISFCPFCGEKIPNAVVIQGKETVTVPVTIKFCSSCGERIPNAITK